MALVVIIPRRTIHARYGEFQAKISIATGLVIDGSLPRRASRLVSAWVGEHAAELSDCWEQATHGRDPGTIEPLK